MQNFFLKNFCTKLSSTLLRTRFDCIAVQIFIRRITIANRLQNVLIRLLTDVFIRIKTILQNNGIDPHNLKMM